MFNIFDTVHLSTVKSYVDTDEFYNFGQFVYFSLNTVVLLEIVEVKSIIERFKIEKKIFQVICHLWFIK